MNEDEYHRRLRRDLAHMPYACMSRRADHEWEHRAVAWCDLVHRCYRCGAEFAGLASACQSTAHGGHALVRDA